VKVPLDNVVVLDTFVLELHVPLPYPVFPASQSRIVADAMGWRPPKA
jgi:hypothetical protein